jgi:hypothetical protein
MRVVPNKRAISRPHHRNFRRVDRLPVIAIAEKAVNFGIDRVVDEVDGLVAKGHEKAADVDAAETTGIEDFTP